MAVNVLKVTVTMGLLNGRGHLLKNDTQWGTLIRKEALIGIRAINRIITLNGYLRTSKATCAGLTPQPRVVAMRS